MQGARCVKRPEKDYEGGQQSCQDGVRTPEDAAFETKDDRKRAAVRHHAIDDCTIGT